MIQDNTKRLKNAQKTTKLMERSSFFSLSSIYRRFIPMFRNIDAPLNKILQKNTPDSFELDDDQLEAFRKFID